MNFNEVHFVLSINKKKVHFKKDNKYKNEKSTH